MRHPIDAKPRPSIRENGLRWKLSDEVEGGLSVARRYLRIGKGLAFGECRTGEAIALAGGGHLGELGPVVEMVRRRLEDAAGGAVAV